MRLTDGKLKKKKEPHLSISTLRKANSYTSANPIKVFHHLHEISVDYIVTKPWSWHSTCYLELSLVNFVFLLSTIHNYRNLMFLLELIRVAFSTCYLSTMISSKLLLNTKKKNKNPKLFFMFVFFHCVITNLRNISIADSSKLGLSFTQTIFQPCDFSSKQLLFYTASGTCWVVSSSLEYAVLVGWEFLPELALLLHVGGFHWHLRSLL